MKFKKVLVTGLSESEMKSDFWSRIKNVTDNIEFSSTTGDELISLLSDVDCLFVKFNGVTKEMIDNAPNLKYIGVFGTGFGKVDAEYAKSKGITVCNVPGYSTESVAEFVFAVVLEHIRELERTKKEARGGNYSEDGYSASEIKDKTFGIIGLGKIGLRTAEIALGFGARVKYWSRSEKDVGKNMQRVEVDEVLSSSDILSLHLSLNSDTETFLNSERINNMVISVFRNHEELKYPYGNKAKERFRVRGQLFERKKVHLVRIIQDKQNGSRVCEMQIMQEAKKSENDPYRNWYRHRLLPTATCISIGKRS